MSQEIPPIAKKILFTASNSAARATFLAGFTYYQIGRYNFTAGSDTTYIVFNVLSFVLSTLGAAMSTYITYYLERSHTFKTKLMFVELTNDTYVRGTFRCFAFASMFYCIGLARIGWVYFGNLQYKWMPFTLMIFTTIMVFYSLYLVFKHAITLSGRHKRGESLGNIELPEKVTIFEEFLNFNSSKSITDDLVSTMFEECNLIAGRAIYVAGMIQNGILRYIPTDYDGTNNWGHVYLFCATAATALCLWCGIVLSVVAIFIQDAEDSYAKHFCVAMLPLVQYAFVAFYAGIVFCMFSIILMPWGCNYQVYRAHNLVLGTLGLLILLAGFYCIYRNNKATSEAKKQASLSTSVGGVESGSNATNATLEEQKAILQRLLTKVNNIGSQATLASAFVWYNIDTLQTDVMSLPFQNYIYTGLFIMANLMAVVCGVTSATLDVSLTTTCRRLLSVPAQVQFLHRCFGVITSIDILFVLALASWFVIFALFGLAKFNPESYIPLAFSVAGGVITVGGVVFLEHRYTWFKYLTTYPHEDTLGLLKVPDADGGSRYVVRDKILNDIAFQVLFMGGFAYNAVCFYPEQTPAQHPYDHPYLALMSISFIASLIVISWSAFYNIKFCECQSINMKYLFAKSTEIFYQFSIVLSSIVLAALLAAFSIIGYVKSRSFYTNWYQTVTIMTVFSIFSFCLCALSLFETTYHFRAVTNSTSEALKASTDNGDFSYKRMLSQIAAAAFSASFVAGNVCYEILFSQSLAPIKQFNYVYFILDNWTFAAGVATVAISAQVAYFMAELETETHRNMFGLRIKYLKQRVFLLTASSLFTWMMSVIFLAYVKYSTFHKLAWPGMVFGTIGCVLYLHMTYTVKKISDRIVKQGNEELSK